jgi:hypothetical protein
VTHGICHKMLKNALRTQFVHSPRKLFCRSHAGSETSVARAEASEVRRHCEATSRTIKDRSLTAVRALLRKLWQAFLSTGLAPEVFARGKVQESLRDCTFRSSAKGRQQTP